MQPKSLTVVQMLPELESGGVERGTLEMGAYLARHGHKSIVISRGGRLVPQLEREGSQHVSLPVGRKSPLCLLYILKVRDLLLKEKTDILHLRSRMPAWVGYLAVKSLPASHRPHVITTFHGYYSVNRYSVIMAKGERVIAISKTVSDHIQKNYEVPPERIDIIHRGFDGTVFHPDLVSPERVERLRSQWGLNHKPTPIIILPGRITRLKGYDIFIRSLGYIRHLPWTAICVGDTENNTNYQKSLMRLIHRSGLEDRIQFTGYCPDMPAAFMLSDIAVSASSIQPEAFGRITIEAQAMGIPVVATAHGGSLETVLPDKTGWLVPPLHSKAMAHALSKAITEPKIRVQFGRNGIEWVRSQFSSRNMCEKTIRLYQSVANPEPALASEPHDSQALKKTDAFRSGQPEYRPITKAPLTIVQMLPELESGGVERGTLEMGAYLSRHGHRSIVISGGGRLVSQLQKEGSRHVTVPVGEKSPRSLLSILTIRKFLLREKPDVLHLRSRLPAWVGYAALKSLPRSRRPRVVTTFHGIYSINPYSAIMTKGERVIAISKMVANHIESHYGVQHGLIKIIPRGVDEAIFQVGLVTPERIDQLRTAWELTNAPTPVIILPARITEWKGHDVFIHSLSHLRQLPWTAICVGDLGGKMAYYQQLLQSVSRLGLEERVRFVGHCGDIPAALMLSDIAVSAASTQPEAFGRVAIEAQAMGVPVVATAHGGSLETVLPGKTGWLVPPGNSEAMALALYEAITNPAMRQQFGKNAAAWIQNHFTARAMCEETLRLYQSIVAEGHPRL